MGNGRSCRLPGRNTVIADLRLGIHRWGSPLFLLGESYGTFRAAALANVLAENGVPLNGVALLEASAFHTSSKRRRWFGSRAETCIWGYGQHESFSDIEEFYMKKILIQ
jgi:hypothetical protein